MEIRTRRWNDPPSKGDGWRLLACRYRPRGVRKADETWDAWWPNLGPSRELHAAFYGKGGRTPLTWSAYKRRYLAEMKSPLARKLIDEVARKASEGPLTLLCSSGCVDESHCHRTLLRELVIRRAKSRT